MPSAARRSPNTLRRKRAAATFFINGSVMRQAPARWRSILAGFPVANHSYSHADLALLSQAAIRSEVAGDEARIEAILRRPMLRLLRPPYGAYDADVLAVAGALGYRLVLWDVDGRRHLRGRHDERRPEPRRPRLARIDRAAPLRPGGDPGRRGPHRRFLSGSRGYRLVDLGAMLGLTPAKPPGRPRPAGSATHAAAGSTGP